MSDYGAMLESGAVRFERLLSGPIERVWSYLTDSELRGKWLASGDMEICPGGRVELFFRHADLSPTKEPIPDRYKNIEKGVKGYEKVIRCEPPRLLSITWGFDEPGSASEVTFELTPRNGQVQLILTHRRLADRAAMVSVAGGWHTHLAILADILNGIEPRPFWSTHASLANEYKGRIPA